MAKKVNIGVIKTHIQNAAKSEAVKIVDKYVNEITPKIKEELTEMVTRNLFAMVETCEEDSFDPQINIIFQPEKKKEPKNARTN